MKPLGMGQSWMEKLDAALWEFNSYLFGVLSRVEMQWYVRVIACVCEPGIHLEFQRNAKKK